MASGVTSMIGEAVASSNAAEDIEGLADEVAGWMGLPAGPGPGPGPATLGGGVRRLPESLPPVT